jgi:hypothetical protein
MDLGPQKGHKQGIFNIQLLRQPIWDTATTECALDIGDEKQCPLAKVEGWVWE